MLKGKSDVLIAIIDTFKSSCFKHVEILCKSSMWFKNKKTKTNE